MTEQGLSAFDRIKKSLEKASQGSRMMVLSKSEMARNVVYTETNTHDLNRILSGSLYRAIPSRTHTLMVGPEASGKSSFMCLNLAAAQRIGYTPVIIDAEGAWTPEFVQRWGVDPERAIVIQTPWVEDILVELAKFVNEGYTKLAIALDSIGALESRKMIVDGTKGDVKADQGGLQKKIKRVMKMMVSITKFQDSLSFSAGHYYGNPTGYGEPEQIGGGKYPRLAADIIITLKRWPIWEFPTLKGEARGKVLGTTIKAATIKNRYFPPFQEATIEINYADGVNELSGLLDVAKDMGIVEVSGSWYTCPVLDIKTQGASNFNEIMSKMDDLTAFMDAIEDKLRTQGYSSVNVDLEELTTEDGSEETQEEEQPKTPKTRKKK